MGDLDDPYAQPALYDLEYEDYLEDLLHYVALARHFKGPILELGCGTGRVTIPIARAGIAVDAIDAHPAMLEVLSEKLLNEPAAVREKVRFARHDFRAFTMDRQYPLALLPFNALHHCDDDNDVLAVLDCVRTALKPRGVFGLDLYLPDRELYQRDPNERFEEREFKDPRDGGILTSWEQGGYDPVSRIHSVTYCYQRADGHIDRSHLRLRMWERFELQNLFEKAGFSVMVEASDFKGGALTPKSLKWVVVLRAR